MSEQRKEKTVLCLWSGGLDSTYMVYNLLRQGYDVDFIYVEIVNNDYKVLRENAAIDALMKTFESMDLPGKITNRFDTKLTVAFPSKLIFTQLFPFIYGILNFISDHHEYVSMGYVMGDDMVSFIPELKSLWKKIGNFLAFQKLPSLEFPLIKRNKLSIYEDLPLELRQDITWCETYSTEKVDNCGLCIPCKKMAMYTITHQRYSNLESKLLNPEV